MQNSDNTLNLKQALLELLKVVKKNHYTKDENDSKLSLKVDDIIYQVDKNNLESEIKNLELSDEQIIGIINNEIKALIPNQATNENQLADKDFVNSSISTATATFRGTYTSKSDFPLINVDINDYLWYDTIDNIGNRKFDKYKYDGISWVYEYTLNNSSFTSDQWKAINSGITEEQLIDISKSLDTKVDKIEGKGLSTNDFTNELKEKLNGIEANAQVNTITGVKGSEETVFRTGNVSISKENIGLSNVDNTSDMDKPISTAQQQGLNKPLYNLGAFDTISGNVITRQTGYVDLKELSYNYESDYFYSVFINSERPAQYYQGVIIPNYTSFTTWSDFVSQTTVNSTYLDGNGHIYIRNTSCSTETQLKATFKNLAQYKLATSYTEEIIEGQPLITLDSQGSQWLRSEWEKGLNLLDLQDVVQTTIDGITYKVENGIITCNGQATDNINLWLLITKKIPVGNYYFAPNPNTSNVNLIYNVAYGPGAWDQRVYSEKNSGFTVSTDYTIGAIGLQFVNGNYYNATFKPMLNEGTEPLPYQEYNGSIVREKQIEELKNEINSLKERIALLESK